MVVARGVVVDNADPGFSLTTDPGYHDFERSGEAWTATACTDSSGGVGADFVTAPTGYQGGEGQASINGATMAALASWEAELKPGTYQVYAYVVPSVDNTRY
ncbi:MAG TPA: hypothetical protein VEY30_11180, partial [Myxococcaceae bacterium]|nr:hypothetical protein [Myxococcaceae bacterium]